MAIEEFGESLLSNVREQNERLARKERKREENSKSARIAKKLEQMRMTQDLIAKIKYRNEKR